MKVKELIEELKKNSIKKKGFGLLMIIRMQ